MNEAFEAAMKQTWQMVDPLSPPGTPGSYARGHYQGMVDALTTLRANYARAALEAQAAQPLTRTDGMPTSETERKLRRMLCAVYAGSVAYMDDGEASLGDRIPFIDFMRMTPDEIDGAMRKRALAMLAAAPTAATAAEAMTDRELLEKAAKAAGIEFVPERSSDDILWLVGGGWWSPKHDDGDALRLAVKLGLYIEGKFTAHLSVKEFVELGELPAVRRAIVRAAAAMTPQPKGGDEAVANF